MHDQNTLDCSLRQVEVRLKLIDGPPLYGGTSVSTPQDAVDMMRYFLSEVDREYFCIVAMDASMKPLHFNVVSIGDISNALVPIQNVFKTAILTNSSGILCFHSHPSGDVTPSEEDLATTKRVVAAGNLLNIKVYDHIIIGGGTADYLSLHECSPELFKIVPILEELPTQDRSIKGTPENENLAAEASHGIVRESPRRLRNYR